MAYKLVRFVEDLILSVCHTKSIKNYNSANSIISAKYQSHFYPALLLNEGTKQEILLLKARYLEHDLVLEKYFRFVPTSSNPCIQNTVSTQTEEEESRCLQISTNPNIQRCGTVSTQTEKLNNNIATASTQTEFKCHSPRASNDTSNINNMKTCIENHEFSTQQILNPDEHTAMPMGEENMQCFIKRTNLRQPRAFNDTSNINNMKTCIENHEFSTQQILNPDEHTASMPMGEENMQCFIKRTNLRQLRPRVVRYDHDQDTEEDLDFSPEDSADDYTISEESSSSLSVTYDNDKWQIAEATENNKCYAEPNTPRPHKIRSPLSETFIHNEINDRKTLADPTVVEPNDSKIKLYFCIYCKKKVSRFARHIEIKHKFEKEVADIIKLKKGDAKRMSLITDIRNRGTFQYNTDARLNKGDVLVARRPQASKRRKVQDYTPCPKCKNFLRKNLLYRHYKRCGNTVARSVPRTLQAHSRATLYEGTINCKWLQDEILVKLDALIILYGSYLCMRHDGERRLTNMIRQKLRHLGHFLINMRKVDLTVTTLESVFNPEKYDNFVKAVRLTAGYNSLLGSYRAPSLPNVLGPLLKECAEKLIVEYVKKQNQVLTSTIESWLGLYRIEYPLISRRANKIIARRKWNNPRLLPLTEDILSLNNYLQTNFKQSMEFLEKGYDYTMWVKLSKSTLLLILIFNRKRVGEMEKLRIEDYKNRHNIQIASESYKSLKPSEQIFSRRYMHIEIRGKLGRPVCLMISHEQEVAINLILKYRMNANVQFDNPFVFGRSINKHFEGARCLRETANLCGAKQPHLLRGTKLRKHIATVSQALNLTENELAILADFMGHNIDIHRNFYGLPNEAIHLAKISQLLFALDNNIIHTYKGKSLDEINIEDVDIDDEEADGYCTPASIETAEDAADTESCSSHMSIDNIVTTALKNKETIKTQKETKRKIDTPYKNETDN